MVDPTSGALQDVVLSRDGRWIYGQALVDGSLCLTAADLETGAIATFDAPACDLAAIAALDGPRAVALTGDGLTVLVIDPAASGVGNLYTGEQSLNTLRVAPDGQTLAVANLPATPAELTAWETDPLSLEHRRVMMIDAASGAAEDFVAAFAVRDIDFSADRMILTMSAWDKFGLPNATLQLFDRASLEFAGDVTFPNCADDLRLQPEGALAVLAPRTCSLHEVIIAEPEIFDDFDDVDDWEDWEDEGWEDDNWEGDPISIVDVDAVEHRANVPGFGPVEWSPEGDRVVGFTVRETLMREWNYFQHRDFGLIVVDVESYTWDVYDVGESRPSYRFSPDGAGVYVHAERDGAPFSGLLDLDSADLVELDGPTLDLGAWIVSPDGSQVYTTQGGGLYRLATGGTAVGAFDLDVTGDVLNVRPQGDKLIWTDRGAATHHLVSLGTLSLVSSIAVP